MPNKKALNVNNLASIHRQKHPHKNFWIQVRNYYTEGVTEKSPRMGKAFLRKQVCIWMADLLIAVLAMTPRSSLPWRIQLQLCFVLVLSPTPHAKGSKRSQPTCASGNWHTDFGPGCRHKNSLWTSARPCWPCLGCTGATSTQLSQTVLVKGSNGWVKACPSQSVNTLAVTGT